MSRREVVLLRLSLCLAASAKGGLEDDAPEALILLNKLVAAAPDVDFQGASRARRAGYAIQTIAAKIAPYLR